jgi:polyketide biosynthesis acyl carrier protein
MTRDEIYAVLRRTVARVLPDVEPERVIGSATLKDLGADSVDRSDILAGLKEEIGLTVSVAELGQTKDIAELVELLFVHARGR